MIFLRARHVAVIASVVVHISDRHDGWCAAPISVPRVLLCRMDECRPACAGDYDRRVRPEWWSAAWSDRACEWRGTRELGLSGGQGVQRYAQGATARL